MFKIKKKEKTASMIWDNETKTIICKFGKDGMFETGDKTVAEKLKNLGHEVTEEKSQKEQEEQAEIEKLKAYAATNNIDLGNATSLSGIQKKIAEAKKGE